VVHVLVRPQRFRTLAIGTAAIAAAALFAAAGPSVESASAGTCPNASSKPGKIGQKEARHAVVCVVNARRQLHGKGSVDAEAGLQKAAARHSRRMVRRNCFSHQCPGEKDLGKRVSSTSYLPCGCSWGVGENIGWGKKGQGTPKQIVKAWMNSSGHRRVLLDGGFEHIGIGAVWGSPYGSSKRVGTYTATFGFKSG